MRIQLLFWNPPVTPRKIQGASGHRHPRSPAHSVPERSCSHFGCGGLAPVRPRLA
jgi:hypothetical protein